MRVLTLNYEFPPLGGGAAPVALEIARGLVGRGHDVNVITMSYKGLSKAEWRDGICIRRVPSLRKRPDICTTAEMASFVASALPIATTKMISGKYDVAHCHFAVPTGPVAWWLRKALRLPYVLTSHGSDIPGYNPDRFSTEHRFTGAPVRAVLKEAHSVVSPSSYLAGLIQDVAPQLGRRLRRISNGIHTEDFRPGRKERIVLGTGRLLPRKGFQHVIRALAALDGSYTFHLCGDGPMRAELEHLAAQLQTPVVFHGWVDSESHLYRDLLARASIYALPSSRENASISLLEAMSAGCAVITSNVSGCPETVGDAGILVPPEDVKALAAALKKLMDKPSLAEDLGIRARRRVENHFDWNVIVGQYEALLREAATEAKGGTS